MQEQDWLLLALVVVRRIMKHSDVNPTPFNTVITEPKDTTPLETVLDQFCPLPSSNLIMLRSIILIN
jgi:hypothetical protein